MAAAQVAAEVETLGRGRGGNAEAYRLYLQGSFFIDRNLWEENARGMGMLRQALALQPDFALAWTGLARGYRHEAEFFSAAVAPSYALGLRGGPARSGTGAGARRGAHRAGTNSHLR